MFQTDLNSCHPLMSALAGDNQKVWTNLTLTSWKPYFLVVYSVATPEGPIRQTRLLSNVDQVADLVSKNDIGFFVEEIQLFTPFMINEAGKWKLECLEEVSTGEDEFGIHRYMYTMANGERYFDVPMEGDHFFLKNVRRVLAFHPKG